MAELIAFLHEQKIVRPGYTTLQSLISEQDFLRMRKNLSGTEPFGPLVHTPNRFGVFDEFLTTFALEASGLIHQLFIR